MAENNTTKFKSIRRRKRKGLCGLRTNEICQPRTQALTYGKDPGWGWSRDFTKIDWLRGEGRVSNCMLPQKTLHFNYKEWIRVI